MEVQKYLEDKLKKCSDYTSSEEDKKFIKKNSLKAFLYKQISRKKFRRWKLQNPAIEKINAALDDCITNNKSLIFRFRFGGYKLWRFPGAPEVDWSEFFTIAHFAEYLAPLASAYKPGIKLYFASDDVFVERLNNIPKSDTEKYYESFQRLLDQFRKYFPSNLEIDILRHSSLFESESEFEQQWQEQVDVSKNIWKSKRSPEQLNKNIKTSWMNVKWDGVEDLTKLSEKEKLAKIEQSVMYHDALIGLKNIRAWSDTIDKIPIFVTSFPSTIGIGATRTSAVRFWVGTGVLEKRNDEYFDWVLSIQQYESIQKLKFKEEKINLIPLQNFSTIKIYNQTFDFSK